MCIIIMSQEINLYMYVFLEKGTEHIHVHVHNIIINLEVLCHGSALVHTCADDKVM